MTDSNTFFEFREPSRFDEEARSLEDAPATEVGEEPDAVDEEEEALEALGDLGNIVDDLFRTWLGDGEAKWAAHAFLCIKRQGLVSEGRPLDYTRNGVFLCTIWALSKEFYAHAFEEGSAGGWIYDIPDLFGEYGLSPVSLGRLAQSEEVDAETYGNEESPRDVLVELIRHFSPRVVGALLAELSDTWALPYLWASTNSDATYPLPNDHPAWGELHHPSTGAQQGYSWIADGMPL